MKTGWIYLAASQKVGDSILVKVFANEVAARRWSQGTTPRALLSNMRFRNKPYRASHADFSRRSHHAKASCVWADLRFPQ
jgi:hypothetical protein